MVKVLIIDKACSFKCSQIKNFDIDKLFKKANLRKKDNFKLRHTWSVKKNNMYVSIYSKDKGKANNENKYDLPPPLDSNLYFGSMILIKHKSKDINNNNIQDISIKDWNNLYEKLFGGFEDLNEEDSYSEEEEIPEHFKTKEGYSKEDGFIVDDDEDEEYIPEEEEEEEAHSSTDSADDEEEIMGQESDIGNSEEEESEEEEDFEESDSDVGSELSEEEYVDSDSN